MREIKTNKILKQIDFSPAGTTKKITDRIVSQISREKDCYHLVKEPIKKSIICENKNVIVVGMPVYVGRIPEICIPSLKNLKGDHTPAIAVVVYGNREYEDALIELCDLLKAQGFLVVGAAAFVAQHSIFPNVAKGRPDRGDYEKIDLFAHMCMEKLQKFSVDTYRPLTVKGNRPYRPSSEVELKPEGNKLCNLCGNCVYVCPTHAINRDNPKITDKKKCISCTACMQVCPTGARKFRGPAYQMLQMMFSKKCAQRKEPEWFL